MAQAIQKVCRFCGIDVSTQKRTKDTLGNYYCQPCYEKLRSPEPTADDVFTCPTCNGSFTRDGMDDSGVCKSCNTAKPTASDTCGSCGASIGEDAAFCARCGAKQSDRLAPDDEVNVTSIIALSRSYSEASLAVSGGEEVEKAFTTALIHGTAFGDADAYDRAKRLHADTTADAAQRARRLKQCDDIKKQLAIFDRKRVAYVRDLILQNDSVDESITVGLRRDAAGIFGKADLGSSRPPPAHPSPSKTPGPKKKSELMNGVWAGPTKRATRKTISPKPLIVGFLCLISAGALAGNANGSPALFAFSVLLSLGGVATMLAWGVIAIVRKLSGSGSRSDAAVAVVEPVTETSQAETSRPFPVGLCIAVGMVLLGVILLVLAVRRFLTATPPSPEDINFVVVSFLLGIVLAVVGFVTWSGACPNCLLLYTSKILDSEHLGTHIETRNESRVARHYDARGGPAQSETHYEVAIPVSVSTSRHTKHCKACGHIWQTTSQTRI